MKKVEVIGHLDCKDTVLRTLQELGVVEIEDVTDQLTDAQAEDGSSVFVSRDSDPERIAAVQESISRIKSALEFLEQLSPRKKSFIEQFVGFQVPLTPRQLDEFLSDTAALDRLLMHIKELEQKLQSLENRANGLKQLIGQMTPWSRLEIPVEELVQTRHTIALAGTVEAEHLHELTNQIQEASDDTAVATVVSQDQYTARTVVIAHRKYEDQVVSVLRSHGFSPQSFPFQKGFVSDFIQETREELACVLRQMDEVVREAKALDGEKNRLWAVLDAYETERDRLLMAERLARTEKAFWLVGWSKADESGRVEDALRKIDDTLVVAIKDPDAGDEPPVVLVNHRLVRPFEVILDLYSLPKTGEIDPTAFVGFFFTLFFAMAAADVGYGVVLAAVCYFLLCKLRMSDLGRKTFELLMISGVASAVFGLATGSLFGFNLGYSLISPVEDPIPFLVLSLGLGVVHLYAGVLLEFYDNVRNGRVMAGVFDQGLWLVFLTSLILLGVQSQVPVGVPLGKYAGYVAIGSAIGLVLTQGRHHSNPLLRIGSGLASLYNVSGYLGDVLSYTRLLGLGMASGVIASVINLVAGMFWRTPIIGPAVTIAILVFGHIFNLFIGVIGEYVHVSRLQYVEFFGKFFEGGGRAFSPFKVKSRYVYITDAQGQGGKV